MRLTLNRRNEVTTTRNVTYFETIGNFSFMLNLPNIDNKSQFVKVYAIF